MPRNCSLRVRIHQTLGIIFEEQPDQAVDPDQRNVRPGDGSHKEPEANDKHAYGLSGEDGGRAGRGPEGAVRARDQQGQVSRLRVLMGKSVNTLGRRPTLLW
jgi:hypothetical protein